jgi:protein-disulfide isomerase
MYDTLFNDVMKRYGDRVKVIYKDFPLYEIHPWAVRAAVNANCLLEQSPEAFWQFSDHVHENQHEISQQEATPEPAEAKDAKAAKDPKGEKPKSKVRTVGLDKLATDVATKDKLDLGKLHACLETRSTAAVRASLTEGKQLGVSATPTLFINGERLEGAASAEEVQAVIDRALRDVGVAVPAAAPAAAPAAKPASK